MKLKFLLLLLIIPFSIKAQITTDGTLGQALSLPGPDYEIGADLGQQYGGHLFHSFQEFNLQPFESATFSGPTQIQNVISRVTGGNPSDINGTIRLIIPDADMYFINPYGIVFGPDARLDVPGSFHASTADYLRLGAEGRFDARQPSESLLTIAPIAAFGFLNTPTSIAVQGHGKLSPDWDQPTGLTVTQGKTLSLIGGQIDISMGHFFQPLDEQGNESMISNHLPILSAPHGRINLAAVASQGEVKLENNLIDVSSFSQLADIYIKEHALLQTSGKGGGNIFIRGGQFLIDNSVIESKTLGDQEGGVIKLGVDSIAITNGAILDGSTEGRGRGSSIDIRATDLISIAGENAEQTQESGIFARSGSFDSALDQALGDDLGNTGHITLTAKNIEIKAGGAISTTTLSKGDAGKVTLKASEMILVTGDGKKWEKVQDSWDGSYIASATFSDSEEAGNAGQILLQAKNISLTDGSYIYSSTEGRGQGGQVSLEAEETVRFVGQKNSAGYPARINIDTQYQEPGAGDAGTLLIKAQHIFLQDESYLDSTTIGKGQGGNITLNATETITFNNSSVHGYTREAGHAGSIVLEAKQITFLNNSKISSDTSGNGNAGPISLIADQIWLTQSNISSDTSGDGNANQVLLIANKNLEITGGLIASGAIGNPENLGNADKVIIKANEVSIMDGEIYSETNNKRNAGKIFLEVNNLLLNQGGRLYTSTHSTGSAGQIKVNASGTVTVTGVNELGLASGLESDSRGPGQGGDILITSQELIVKNGGHISVSSMGNQSGPGGNIRLEVKGGITLVGVNPYGENENGFGSGIYARSIGKNTGASGTIELSADSLTIKEGAVIESSTNNTAAGGNIKIHISGPVHLSGDASQIELFAPAGSQQQYLQEFSPRTYNQSTSGIYANSSDFSELAGLGGNITLTAEHLVMTDKAKISTTSAGGGSAGTITLMVDRLQLDKSAKIASESQLTHNFRKPTKDFVNAGDIVKITDAGSGKVGTRLSTNDKLIVIAPLIDTVANRAELAHLAAQYHLVNGQVVKVKDLGNGQSARFIYTTFYGLSSETSQWVQIQEQQTITLANQAALSEINNLYAEAEQLPYPAGAVIKVNDYEAGKAATFVYTTFFEPSNQVFLGQTIRVLEPLTVKNQAELQQISQQTSFVQGTKATVLTSGDQFIYYNNNWLKFGATHQVANVAELNHLHYAQTGNLTAIVKEGQIQRFIYSGTQWLPVNGDQPRTVHTLAERDQLAAQNGDMVIVEVGETGQDEHYFYAQGEWKKRPVNGGDAGQITIAANTLRLNNRSQISTSAITGGGGQLILNVDKMIYLTNSKISTSVQKDRGDGGDLTIHGSQVVILNNGKLVARANEGQGGNISIATQQLIKSPNSLIDASSRTGIDGEVEIDSPNENVTEGTLNLSYEMADASRMMKKSCETMSYEEYQNRSRFAVHRIAGNPLSPFDLQPSRLPNPPSNTTATKQVTQKMIPPSPPPTTVTVCRGEMKTLTKPKPTNQAIPEQLF